MVQAVPPCLSTVVVLDEGMTVGKLDPQGKSHWESGGAAKIEISRQPPMLKVFRKDSDVLALQTLLTSKSVWRPSKFIFIASPGRDQVEDCCLIKCSSQGIAESLQAALHQALHHDVSPLTPGKLPQEESLATGKESLFEQKTEKSSSEIYFNYYGMIMHQQNMLQDYTRTGTYFTAIAENRPDFEGKTVMDVGAGSGILSLFAAQAGARKVYAVEASDIAKFARQLADGNPALGSRVEVVNGKVEEIHLPEKSSQVEEVHLLESVGCDSYGGKVTIEWVDVLISEPMGTLLVNERMLETYLYARDHFLKPGGKMFPQIGRIHVAAFSDEMLYNEVLNKAYFWVQQNFYGVDVTSLYSPAVDSYFAQVVVDAFDPCVLTSSCSTKVFDFLTVTEESLQDILLPLQLQINQPGPQVIHGVACWFDVFFNGTTNRVWLSTAPGQPATHWFQIRCVLKTPVFVAGPCVLTGQLRLAAHNRQSYMVHVDLQGPPLQPNQPPQTSSGSFDLKEPYYRQLNVPMWQQPSCSAGGQQ